MGLVDWIISKKNNDNKIPLNTSKIMNGYIPVFSTFGKDVYASDLVQASIRAIATEISKLQISHIKENENGDINPINDEITKLFKYNPNPLMTTADFLEKIIWLWSLNNNAFIYPTFIEKETNQGRKYKSFTGFYPINPNLVEFFEDTEHKIGVKLTFENGQAFELLYQNLIHIRKDFSVNDYLGGSKTGKPDDTDLLKVLDANNIVLDGIGNAIKSSLTIKGILKTTSLVDAQKLDKERERFETALSKAQNGIVPIDLGAELQEFKIDPKLIDEKTMNFIENKVFRRYGVSLPIINCDFSEEQFNAFFQKTLEPLINKIEQVFTKVLFTQYEKDAGNKIKAYFNLLNQASLKTQILFVDMMTNSGRITDNQALQIFGYPPYEDGNVRKQSLNYISSTIADEYQLNKTNKEVDIDANTNKPNPKE